MAKFNNAILQLLLHQTNNTVSHRNVMYRTENTVNNIIRTLVYKGNKSQKKKIDWLSFLSSEQFTKQGSCLHGAYILVAMMKINEEKIQVNCWQRNKAEHEDR